MTEPVMTQKSPYKVDVVEGKTYYWCSCGQSKMQPFCDGSHKTSGLEPVVFTADKTATVFLCGCRKTAKAPFCDGTHNKI
ncbi:MAG: CDGSH iron-sulfur domain-containing protein [Gammaproteobacteria bacterium]|nr:CDGSH iron-sulfur domain-containing protein [Gammaproteobacteria bacterium]